MTPSQLLPQTLAIARQAAEILHKVYQSKDYQQQLKADQTPVTSADYAAHDYLTKALAELAPEIPVLSEEDSDIPLSERSFWKRYWLVDPLDGTQEFIARSGDFATVIALVEEGIPVLGVVCAPESGDCYYACRGQGAYYQALDSVPEPIHTRQTRESLTIAVSRRQKLDLIKTRLKGDLEYQFVALGSSSLKSCAVAAGRVDAYLRVGPTGEWDTAAVQCIVEEAGGEILSLQQKPLTYNQRESLENPDFMVLAAKELAGILKSA
ncbi:3'(2'),5'-bisphosphate nucleotidase CysQ [Dongshaea marina]|uniref:3'(2'),5'-bisphosphate nucleotidase CysQ n=1 Tax=Dongshaea marina TaxID=2047966 RepID=UPI000D3E122A|nr:3'(2'),5'-bisphosphate nucleotidase CysQ [Dongshaea marina]